MRNTIKGFIIGLLMGTLGMVTVFAASGIKSAEFNDNKVIYNGKALDLTNAQMISVIKDGEENISNYMPVRAILEQMGYTISWDSTNNSVVINKEYLLNDGTKVKEKIENQGLDIKQFREELAETINLNAVNSKDIINNIEDVNTFFKAAGFNDAEIAVLFVEDYKVFQEGGETFLNDVWEKVFK